MTLRRFQALLVGLSPQSLYVLTQRADPKTRVLKGADVDSYFASFRSN